MHEIFYRGHFEDYEVFRRAVMEVAKPHFVALDVGAGRGAPPAAIRLKGRVERVIGSTSNRVCTKIRISTSPMFALSRTFPGAVRSVDLAYARYVFEHLLTHCGPYANSVGYSRGEEYSCS